MQAICWQILSTEVVLEKKQPFIKRVERLIFAEDCGGAVWNQHQGESNRQPLSKTTQLMAQILILIELTQLINNY